LKRWPWPPNRESWEGRSSGGTEGGSARGSQPIESSIIPPIDSERALRRMKLVATGLLVLMVCIYVVSRMFERRYPFLGAVSAFSEAGCVGALADWFAVVALFRHPLNLPIPRTAIIPRSRDRIGDALARFVMENFLSREILEGRIASADLAGLAGAWMAEERNALQMAERIGEYLPYLAEQVRSRAGAEEESEGKEGARGRVAAMARAVIEPVRRSAFVRKLAGHILSAFGKVLAGRQGAGPTGEGEDGPPEEGPGEDLAGEIARHPGLRERVPFVWKILRDRIIADFGRRDPQLVRQVGTVIQEVGRILGTDERLKGKANEWLRSWVTDAAAENRQVLVRLISETVKKWDPQMTSRRIELHVGKDLQWIRINGTIVGGLAGLLIYVLAWALRSLR